MLTPEEFKCIQTQLLEQEAALKLALQNSYNTRKLLESFYSPARQGKKKGLSDEQRAANKVKFKQQLRKRSA